MGRGSKFRSHSPPAKLIELSLDKVDNEAVIALIRASLRAGSLLTECTAVTKKECQSDEPGWAVSV